MDISEIKSQMAPLFEGCKYQGFQTVHFFYKECVEIGVIQEVKRYANSSQPAYVLTYLNDDFNLVNVVVDEEDIFSDYIEISDFALNVFSKVKYHDVFKHFTKTQFLKQEYMEGLPLDEYIYQPVEK